MMEEEGGMIEDWNDGILGQNMGMMEEGKNGKSKD